MISIVLILAMISSLLQTSNSMAKVEDSYLYSGEGYQVIFFITSSWSDGYVAEVTIKNTGDITSVRTALNGRLYARMENGEEILITRRYAREIEDCFMEEDDDERI